MGVGSLEACSGHAGPGPGIESAGGVRLSVAASRNHGYELAVDLTYDDGDNGVLSLRVL